MTTPQTPGAFAYGLRLMALDSTLEVADMSANARVFGRHVGGRGPSAFPLVRGVYLMEEGSHGIVDAGSWPHAVSEHVGARRLLRSCGGGHVGGCEIGACIVLIWYTKYGSADATRRSYRPAPLEAWATASDDHLLIGCTASSIPTAVGRHPAPSFTGARLALQSPSGQTKNV